jgi:hypothetical protein
VRGLDDRDRLFQRSPRGRRAVHPDEHRPEHPRRERYLARRLKSSDRGREGGGDEREHGRHEQEGDDQLDLRPGAGRRLQDPPRLARSRLRGLGAERRAERGAVALGAAQGRGEGADGG